MKALIITMSCGQGHNMIAKSLAEVFDKKGIENKTIQTYSYSQKQVEIENKKFLWLCKHIPHFYDYVWNKLCKKEYKNDKLFANLKYCLPSLQEEINSYSPNIIICTHVYSSAIIAYMKRHNYLNDKIITSTILHDFCLCPYWECSKDVDYIFQPYENTTNDLISKGFKKEQIKTFGLPTRQQFSELDEKVNYKEKLNLPNKFTALIVNGGGGIGDTLKLIKGILRKNLDIQIVVVNGNNKKNFNKIQKYIQKKNITNITNLDFVTNIAEYYKATDVIITRCGGCGISEMFNLHKPLIAREKLIINEKIIKEMLYRNGCALKMEKIGDAGNCIEKLLDKKVYAQMVENTKKYARPNASKDIVEFLINQVKNK